MNKLEGVGLAVAGGLAGYFFGHRSSGELPTATEPDLFKTVRARVKIWATSYGGGYLEWYPIKKVYSENDQMTVTYALIFPGRGLEGDIEAFAQIYNPGKDENPSNSWANQTFSELVFEIARFGWAEMTILVDSNSIGVFPQVSQDGVIAPGYVTVRLGI